MKILQLSFLFFILMISSINIIAQEKVSTEKSVIELVDLQNLLGEWNGTLTYIDYSSKKPFSMPSELNVASKGNNRKFILSYTYPNEPNANDKSKLKVSKDRSLLDGKPIVSRTQTSDGNTQIITEYSGKDGNENQKALIRNIYIIGKKKFIIRKEVQFDGTKDWIKRSEYNFDKK